MNEIALKAIIEEAKIITENMFMDLNDERDATRYEDQLFRLKNVVRKSVELEKEEILTP